MEVQYIQGELFPDLYSIKKNQEEDSNDEDFSCKPMVRDPFKEEWCRYLSFTSTYQHPIVKGTKERMPYNIMGYHRCVRAERENVCPHFYAPDCLIYRIWSRPNVNLQLLKQHPCTLGPDFSVHNDMPRPMKESNIYLNKLISAWWQYNGIKVYPNVVWTSGVSYDMCFDGLPKHSVVAVNSTGIGKDARARYIWQEGYERMLYMLQPEHIIRYGAKQECERTDISTYFLNDNKRSARHGW